MSLETSRPFALAANLVGSDVPAIEHLFVTRRVLVRLELEMARSAPMREAFLLAVNEILRFCPNVVIAVPPNFDATARTATALAREIYGPDATISTVAPNELDASSFEAILNVGREVCEHRAWIAIDASGWLARIATAACGIKSLPNQTAPPNIFAALAAASLGAGQVFLSLVGRPLLSRPLEVSLWSLETSTTGELTVGPPVPDGLELQALLVGCGGVANGFAHAAARAQMRGRLETVDKQSLRRENFGPYVGARRSRLGKPKTEMIREMLVPMIEVTPRNERFRFFKARIGYGETTPPELILVGLDDERTRHDVQRLWAPITIDMAAEELTSQLILKDLGDDGICLLGAYSVDGRTPSELEQLAVTLGLPVERVAEFESQITAEDIAAAPPEKRQMLEDAHRRDQRICGRATQLDLHEEQSSVAFTPAVPFVTAFSGIVGAAQTARHLMEQSAGSIHFQFSFLSFQGRRLQMRCSSKCECQERRDRVAS